MTYSSTETSVPLEPAHLEALLDCVVELTKLRQNECKPLCIENFSPELFGKMIDAYLGAGSRA